MEGLSVLLFTQWRNKLIFIYKDGLLPIHAIVLPSKCQKATILFKCDKVMSFL
jgi:hypothetical protein